MPGICHSYEAVFYVHGICQEYPQNMNFSKFWVFQMISKSVLPARMYSQDGWNDVLDWCEYLQESLSQVKMKKVAILNNYWMALLCRFSGSFYSPNGMCYLKFKFEWVFMFLFLMGDCCNLKPGSCNRSLVVGTVLWMLNPHLHGNILFLLLA